ncbi:MAG: hypothetical protein IPO21_13530 [Bacteroidales bacterium]|nr:hypothetical protein [Bacteroidales bacterium]
MLTKVLKAVAVIDLAIAVLVCVGFFMSWVNEGMFLVFTYIQVALAAAATIIFSILGFIINPKNAKSVLIGMGSLVFVLGLSWVLATSEIPQFYGSEKLNITVGQAKFVGSSLIAIYILLTLGILGIVGSELYRLIIKR